MADAVAESLFASLRKELLYRQSWPTTADARTALFDYIKSFYNRVRLHLPSDRDRLPITRTALSASVALASPLRGSHAHTA
jgi:transposase InsO family protein